MVESPDVPAWISLFLGLYSLAAAVGEFRHPGGWAKMLAEFQRSHALRYLTGIFCIALGAAIYLLTPWGPEETGRDWLALVISVIGGVCAVEGLLILAAGDRFLGFARKLMSGNATFWAGFAALLGMAFVVAGLARI